MITLNNLKSKTLLTILNCIVFLYALLYLKKRVYVGNIIHTRSDEGYNVTEFLINYQGGFVRRGLLGEILFQLATRTGIDIAWIIYFVSLASFMLLAAIFVHWLREYRIRWWVLTLSFTFFGFDIIRKDALCMLIVTAIVYVLNNEKKKAFTRFVLLNLLATLLWNLHEAYFFVIGPFILYYILFKDKSFNAISWRCLSIAPLMIAAIAPFYFKGTPQIAIDIYRSWHEIYPEQIPLIDETCVFNASGIHANSITALGWDARETVKFHLGMIYGPNTVEHPFPYGWQTMPFVYLGILIFISRFMFLFASTQSALYGKPSHPFASLMTFQFVSLLPMFFGLSCDTARICSYWSLSAMIILFTMGHEKVAMLFPSRIGDVCAAVNKLLDKYLCVNKATIILFMLCVGVPCVGYSLGSLFRSSVIGFLLKVSQTIL